MKKILLAALLLISCVSQAQQATDVTVRQRNAFNTGWLDRFLSPPAGGVDGVLYINGAAVMPGVLTLGPGLSINSGVLDAMPAGAPAWADITGKPSFSTVATSGAYADLSGRPTIPAAQVQSDWVAVSGLGVILNKPIIPSVTPFNFSAPASRSLSVSTQYQAVDNTKASIVTVSPSCVNATTVLASSACTIQVRQASSTGLTCSTGTITMTWSSTVQLGLVFNQTSGSPFDIKIPAGGYFILCATAGNFTINSVEQSAG